MENKKVSIIIAMRNEENYIANCINSILNRNILTYILKKVFIWGVWCNVISGTEGIIVGENAIIEAGTLVKKNIPDDSVVMGIPMKIKE